jgi:hypothetical protein
LFEGVCACAHARAPENRRMTAGVDFPTRIRKLPFECVRSVLTDGSSCAGGVQFFRGIFVASVKNGSAVQAWRCAGLRRSSRARVVQFFSWGGGLRGRQRQDCRELPCERGAVFQRGLCDVCQNWVCGASVALRGTARGLPCESGAFFLKGLFHVLWKGSSGASVALRGTARGLPCETGAVFLMAGGF